MMGIKTAAFVLPCLLACLATNSLARGKFSLKERKKILSIKKLRVESVLS